MGEIQIALQPITGNGSQMASWCSAINPKNHATGAVAWGAVARPLRDPARGLTAVVHPMLASRRRLFRACPERRRLPGSARLAAIRMRESGRRQAKRRLVSFPQRQSSFQSPTDCASQSQSPRSPSRAGQWVADGPVRSSRIHNRSPTPQPRTRTAVSRTVIRVHTTTPSDKSPCGVVGYHVRL